MSGDGQPGVPGTGGSQEREPLLPAEVLARMQDLVWELGRHAEDTEWWRASRSELTELLEAADELRSAAERLAFAVTAQVAEQGIHNEVQLSLGDFLAAHAPSLTPRAAATSARVADRVRQRRNAAIRDAIAEGSLSVERADVLLRNLGRVAPFIDSETYVRHDQQLLPLAQMGADRELRTAVEHLIALATPELEVERLAKAQADSCKVFESSLAGGMRRFVVEADPEGAATLDAIFTSPLTKPVPANGMEDERSPGRRRYDALMTVLDRGMSHPEGVPTTSKLSLMVTVDFDLLRERVGRSGHVTGTQGTAYLSAGTLRRMACQAQIIPAVLGGDSQILDLGRTRRLATPAQLRALHQRDRGCTFPGCTMPAMWTEAHHANAWWSEGGKTDLRDMASVCRRHHGWIHAWDPEVTITDTQVIWHLDRLHGDGGRFRPRLHSDTQTADAEDDPAAAWFTALGGLCGVAADGAPATRQGPPRQRTASRQVIADGGTLTAPIRRHSPSANPSADAPSAHPCADAPAPCVAAPPAASPLRSPAASLPPRPMELHAAHKVPVRRVRETGGAARRRSGVTSGGGARGP
jgi:hypothetical protein